MPFSAFDNYHEFTLANGQRVISFEIPHANVQDVHISLNAGHSHSHEGLSHYTEHIVAHAEKTGEATALRKELEEDGGRWFGGSTYIQRCMYGFALPVAVIEKFPNMLNRLGRYVFGSSLKFDEDIEEGIFKGEFNKKFGVEMHQKLDQIEALSHPDEYHHGMVRRFGDLKTIENRPFEQIKEYYESHYVPANSTIITAGPLNVEQLKEYLEASNLDDFERDQQPALDQADISTKPSTQDRRYAFEYPSITSVYYKNQRNLDNRYNPFEIEMARRVLYRMTKDCLREEAGLVYGVDAYSFNIPGGFTLGFSTNGLEPDDIEKFQEKLSQSFERMEGDELDEVMKKIKKARPNQIKAKEHLTPDVVTEAAQHLSDYKKILTNDEYIEGLQGVSPDRVRGILETLNPEHKHYQRWLLPKGVPAPQGYTLSTMDETLESLKQEAGLKTEIER